MERHVGRSAFRLALFSATLLFCAPIVSSLMTSPSAYAHRDPSRCATNGISMSLAVFRDAALTIPALYVTQADVGSTIYFQGTLGKGPRASDCAYEGGTATIVLPNATSVVVLGPGSSPFVPIKCIGGTAPNTIPPGNANMPCTNQVPSQDTNAAPYVVNFSDLQPNKKFKAILTLDSHSHFNSDDSQIVQALVDISIPVASTNLTKSASDQKVIGGTTVTYTYNETNDGGTDLYLPYVTDDKCSPVKYVSGDKNGDGILNPAESWIFECKMTLTGSGVVTNNAIGHATLPDDANLTSSQDPDEEASVSVTVINPNFSLSKTCESIGQTTPGSIKWDIKIKNTGDVPLTISAVSDTTTNQTALQTTLLGNYAPGQTKTFTQTITGLPAGTYVNTVTATGEAQLFSQTKTATASCTVQSGFEGQTPGFWKTHPELWDKTDNILRFDTNGKNYDDPTKLHYFTTDKFSSVFGVIITITDQNRVKITDPTLLQALGANGGINEPTVYDALARQAVAAILNADNPYIDYPWTAQQVIDAVKKAITNSDFTDAEPLKNTLEKFNMLGNGIDSFGRPI